MEGSHNILDYIGNTIADAAAGVGATNEIGRSVEPQNMERVTRLAIGIITRSAMIEARRWDKGKKVHYEPMELPEQESMVMGRRTRLLERRVELMGHKLISDGNWYKCTGCRKKCMKTNYEGWVNTKCEQMEGDLGQSHGRLAHVRGEVGKDSDIVCSQLRRKRLVGKQKETLEARKAQDHQLTKAAWVKANYAISWTLWGRMSSGHNHPPIKAHWSHALISCGGFGGCIRCGSVAGYCKNSKLEARCRGHCPIGSRGPIRRLAMGKYPHPQRGQGRVWVDGTINPQPTKWKVDKRIDMWDNGSQEQNGANNATATEVTSWDCADDSDYSGVNEVSTTNDGMDGREADSDSTGCGEGVQSGKTMDCNVSACGVSTSVMGNTQTERHVAKRARFRF